MWRDSYRIGVRAIDEQHMELFAKVKTLLKMLGGAQLQDKAEYATLLTYFKNYAIMHFSTEEAYQASIGYEQLEEHRLLHKGFTTQLLLYEKELADTDYNIATLKRLAGFLTSWLIYHVADADQRIRQAGAPIVEDISAPASYRDCFLESLRYVLMIMTGIEIDGVIPLTSETAAGGAFIRVRISGGKKGNCYLQFPKKTALHLVEKLTYIHQEEIDDVVSSALSEIGSLVCENAVVYLSGLGLHCEAAIPDIVESMRLDEYDGFCAETALGKICVAIGLEP